MLRLHRRIQQVIARPRHRLPPRRLRLEAVSLIGFHAYDLGGAEVLLDDGDAVEGDAVLELLDAFEFRGEHGQGVVCGVADEEAEVDEVVGVGELGD